MVHHLSTSLCLLIPISFLVILISFLSSSLYSFLVNKLNTVGLHSFIMTLFVFIILICFVFLFCGTSGILYYSSLWQSYFIDYNSYDTFYSSVS